MDARGARRRQVKCKLLGDTYQRYYAATSLNLKQHCSKKGVRFEHPGDDPVKFRVADNDVEVVGEIARRRAICAYLKDDYVIDKVAFGDRHKDSADL